MFTGIVSAVGLVKATAPRLVIETRFTDVNRGESIAVNGTCLTATSLKGSRLTFFVSAETLARTNLGQLRKGSRVNLERAMRLGDRVSGHLVQGHVDGLGRLKGLRKVGAGRELTVKLKKRMLPYVIEKGSIALDGVSLTVNAIRKSTVKIMIIPHTWRHTTLSRRKAGEVLNVELDMIAKYAEKRGTWTGSRKRSKPSAKAS